MASGVDGTVKIDTSIDASGFNAGMKKLALSAQTALAGVLKPFVYTGYYIKETFSKLGSAIGSVFNFLKKLLVGTLFVLALSLSSIFKGIQDAISGVLKLAPEGVKTQVEAIKNKWEEVKAAVGLAFLPLITAALPYIQLVEDWLIKVFNTVAQIVAAFLGQKQVLQVIPGSAAKLAKETEKTKKNAQGALAAFDQINVLAKQQNDTSSTSPSDSAKVAAQMVPITDDILSKVQAIKDIIAAWWADPIGKLKETWGAIVQWFKDNVINPLVAWWNTTWLGQMLSKLWDSFKGTWDKLIANTKQTFEDIKGHILQAFNGVKEFLKGVFTGDWATAWQGLKDIVIGVFGAMWDYIKGAITGWLILFQWLKAQLTPIISAVWDWMKSKAGDALTNIKSVWGSLLGWFSSLLSTIGTLFQTVFGGIRNYVLGVLNSIISTISLMFNTIINSVNGLLGLFSQPQLPTVPATADGGSVGGSAGGHSGSGSIPRLATGAVIPPNQQFAAILGDQRTGTNIEAPADLIRQIVAEQLANNPQQTHVTVEFKGSLAAFVRELQPVIKAENVRTGRSLK